MNTNTLEYRRTIRPMTFIAASGFIAAALCGLGCQSEHAAASHPVNPALRPLVTPAGGNACDADRAALARFVGAWTFEGWTAAPGASRSTVAGRAAGVIEHENFVQLDVQTTSGELGAYKRNRAVSLLMGAEPGVGATLTIWGDASASIGRLTGRVEGKGSAFSFVEAKPPAGVHRLNLTMTFQTDDQWLAEIRDLSESGHPVIAEYRFTRSVK